MTAIKNYIEKLIGEKLNSVKESNNNIIWKSDRYIYKFFKENNKENFDFENKVLQILKTKKIKNIPELLDSQIIKYKGSQGFLIKMNVIEGIGVKYIRNNIDKKEKDRLVCDIINILIKIHKLKINSSFDNIKFENIYLKWLTKIDSKLGELSESLFFNKNYKDIIDNFTKLCNLHNQKNIQKLSIIHNDIRISNILYNQSYKRVYIIDFENGFVGPNIYDFYKILCQYYYAMEEKSKIEIDFTYNLIVKIVKIYPEILKGFDIIDYNIFIYNEFLTKSFSRKNKRYNHEENERFLKFMLNLLKYNKVLGGKTEFEICFGVSLDSV